VQLFHFIHSYGFCKLYAGSGLDCVSCINSI
jgi:hypothetical protein